MSELISTTPLNDGSGLSTYLYSSGLSITQEPPVTYEPTAEEIEEAAAAEARQWRDGQLSATDTASQTPDWPNRDNILLYRTALRNWPSTSAFPSTRPTLGE